MPAAEQLVAHDVAEQLLPIGTGGVADHHDVALVHDGPVDGPRGSLAPHQQAPTAWGPGRRDLQHPLGAVEQHAAEVRDQPEREHIHAQIVDDAGQLVALLRRVEPRLVAHEVVERLVGAGELEQVEFAGDLDRRHTPRRLVT